MEWSASFASGISIDPESLGLDAAMSASYSATHDQFAQELRAAIAPSTRGPSACAAKDQARRDLEAEARRLARIIQAHPGVTDQQRYDLGLTIRDESLTHVRTPRTAPDVEIKANQPRRVRIRLGNGVERARRGRPPGTAGAMIFSYVGDEPSSNADDWQFRHLTTRTLTTVRLPASIPAGAKLWLSARWLSTRLEPGPAAAPVSIRVQEGIARQ